MMPVQIVFGFTVAVLLASMADSMFDSQGLMNPAVPKACISDDLNITCNYTGNGPKPKLVFTSDPARPRWDQTADVYATYLLSNISANDNNVNIICCRERCDPFSIVGIPVILQVYSQPIPLQNFNCVIYNYHENMTCTWNLGQKYERTPPDIECNLRLPNNSASWTNCNHYTTKFKDVITVVLPSTTAGDFSMKLLDFKMTVDSQCGKNVSEVYHVDTRNIVRPAPAKDLTSFVINSTCIEWGYKQEVYLNYTLKYTLTVSSRWNDTQVITGVSEEVINIQVVCDLHPYTEYTLTVQLHPVNKGYWSLPASISDTTLQSVPSSSPELIRGSYSWDPQDCRDGNHRDLTVYWQDIPSNHKNGEISYFNVTLTPLDGGGAIMESDVASMIRQKSFLGRRVRCDTDYTVTVTAYTIIGPSPENYTIGVAKLSKDLPQPAFWAEIVSRTDVVNGTQIVAIHLGKVSKEVEDELQVQSFTVCYCRKSMGNCQNDDPVKCSYAKGSEISVHVTVTFPEDYMYGVSMTTPIGDSGLIWQSCLYLQNAELTKPPSDVTARTGAEDNTIMVLWSPLPCESDQPYIAYYSIQYCPQETSGMPCSGSCKELNVSRTASSYTIEGLNEDQNYCFTVMGVTPDGRQGPASEPVFAVAGNNDLKPGAIAGIVIGGLFMLIIIGSVIFFVFRNCHQRITLWKRQKMEVTIPEIKATDGSFNACYDDSGDPTEEYGNVPSKPDVEVEDLDNETKPDHLDRQMSDDSGVVDLASPTALPEGYCRVASQGLFIVREDKGFQRETVITGHMGKKLPAGHLEMRHTANMNQAVTDGLVEMGTVNGLDRYSKGRVEIGQEECVETQDEAQPQEININYSEFKHENNSEQLAINSDPWVNPSPPTIGSYVPFHATESTDNFDSGGHNQKRNIHNLKFNVHKGSGFHQSSDPSIPNTDYVFAINGEMTPQDGINITSESPKLVKLQCVPMPNAFKTPAGKQQDSLIQENGVLDLVLESSSYPSNLSQSLSNAEPVESDYMKADSGLPEVYAFAVGYVINGAEVKKGDNRTLNMSTPINNKPGLTNNVSTADDHISNNQNEEAIRRHSSGRSYGSDSTDSGVNSDRANPGSQRSSLSGSGDESNVLATRELQPDKSGYVLAAHMDPASPTVCIK